MRRNNTIQISRVIVFEEGNTMMSNIKKDKDFNNIAIDKIRNSNSNKINLTCNIISEANKFDNLFNSKYKEGAKIVKKMR